MKISNGRGLFLLGIALLLVSGCASLEVTARKELTPVTERQGVTLGVQAGGDRLTALLADGENSLLRTASVKLFDKVQLLPKESKFMPLPGLQSTYGVDYLLAVSIGDISVSGDLNPIWFLSLPLLFFKVYAPIVTFQPGVALDVSLRDARSGAVLMQKQVMEAGIDHYAPADPAPKVRKLIALTLNNALVEILRDAQQSIAAAKKAGT